MTTVRGMILVVLLLLISALAFAAGGAGSGITLDKPDTKPGATYSDLCLSQAKYDLKNSVAVVEYEPCPLGSSLDHYVLRVDRLGWRLDGPNSALTTGSSFTWTEASKDFNGVPSGAKSLMLRARKGS